MCVIFLKIFPYKILGGIEAPPPRNLTLRPASDRTLFPIPYLTLFSFFKIPVFLPRHDDRVLGMTGTGFNPSPDGWDIQFGSGNRPHLEDL
jgi:hypothetical protein